MHKELIRLSTFADWRQNAKISPLQLARNGFFYSRNSDESVCFSCDFRISSWNEQQDPLEEHRQLSSNCPLITGTETRNIPLTPRTSTLGPPPPPSGASETRKIPLTGANAFTSEPPPQSPQGASERLIDVSSNSLNNVFQSALNRANAKELFSNGPNSTNSRIIDRNNPDFIQLRHETVRLGTFDDWPSTALASPWALAREGFFYTGIEDRVQCAFCRGCLKRWQPGDHPSQEHSKHYPSCPLVLGLDVGNVPANGSSAVGAAMTQRPTAGDQRSLAMSEGFNLESGERSQTSMQAPASQTMDQAVRRSTEHVNELIDLETRMSVAAVRAVLDMGFSRAMVKRTIENKLSTTGTDFPDAESLLDALFLAGETTTFHNDGSASPPPAAAAVAATSSASSYAAAGRNLSSAITSSNSTVSTSAATSALTSQSVDVIGTTATSRNAVTGFASLLSTHSWKDSGIFSLASSSSSLPTIYSSLQLPSANSSSSSSLSSSNAAASVPPEPHPLVPVKPVASSASATMATIPEVGTSSITTKLKAKRKRNKKKIPSTTTPSNKDTDQDPQSNGKTGEEAAGREEEREPDAEADNESLKYLEENRQLREARTCKVCMDSEVNTVFLPCGHLVCCNNCSPQLRNCPICRTFIRGTVKTSIS